MSALTACVERSSTLFMLEIVVILTRRSGARYTEIFRDSISTVSSLAPGLLTMSRLLKIPSYRVHLMNDRNVGF